MKVVGNHIDGHSSKPRNVVPVLDLWQGSPGPAGPRRAAHPDHEV